MQSRKCIFFWRDTIFQYIDIDVLQDFNFVGDEYLDKYLDDLLKMTIDLN
jgi:hypothetical protein